MDSWILDALSSFLSGMVVEIRWIGQEQAPAAEEKPKAADAKPEEKKTEEGEKKKGEEGEKKTGEEGEKKAEEGKKEEEEPPKPPSPPFVLYVDLHCQGCAKKIERSIMRLRGA